MDLESKIEAVLFYKNEPIEIKELSKLLEVKESEVGDALQKLGESLQNRGVRLIQTDTEAGLATAPELNGLMEKIAKDEMSREIGKAGLETLAIVLYNGPISRREVDYIRGVNSAFILRSLAMRGFVEREPDKEDQRVMRYRASTPLFAHLGIGKMSELPEFENFKSKIAEAITNNDDTG